MPASLLCAACRRAATTTTIHAPRAMLLSRHLSSTLITTRRQSLLAAPPRHSPRTALSPSCRAYSSSAPETPSMSAAEAAIAQRLADALAPVAAVLVQDVSGGCGSMYAIDIAAEAFRGHTMLKQQRMVNAALGDAVRTWHGVQIRTRVPEDA